MLKEPKPVEIDEEHKVGKWFTGLIPCWIDAPSTLQPAHSYHGKNVIAIHEKSGGYRCCCVDDEKPTTFSVAENTHLVEGWKDRKPAEWSEEDERIRKNLMSLFYDLRISKRISYEVFNKYYPWLRSLNLQTRWKPSEEQMDWTETAYRLSEDKPGIHKIIGSLLDDLKKFTEE